MNTIYWITRLDGINKTFTVAFALSTIVLVITVITYYVDKLNDWEDEDYSALKKLIKISAIALSISLVGTLFIPTSKDMYAIYGIGGTIDYIKQNKQAKNIPDKCINALDRYLDTVANDSIKNNKK